MNAVEVSQLRVDYDEVNALFGFQYLKSFSKS